MLALCVQWIQRVQFEVSSPERKRQGLWRFPGTPSSAPISNLIGDSAKAARIHDTYNQRQRKRRTTYVQKKDMYMLWYIHIYVTNYLVLLSFASYMKSAMLVGRVTVRLSLEIS